MAEKGGKHRFMSCLPLVERKLVSLGPWLVVVLVVGSLKDRKEGRQAVRASSDVFVLYGFVRVACLVVCFCLVVFLAAFGCGREEFDFWWFSLFSLFVCLFLSFFCTFSNYTGRVVWGFVLTGGNDVVFFLPSAHPLFCP